ncbi:hypothetical protein AGMMS50262_23260 [Bacteroidia bacterium]|nr:hypothetical protein AGMMS50262_23260 [Bacteroidia bacterium]
MDQERPKIICLTPVKNEAWILDKFLKAVSLWADHIIIADQMSTDGSREICKKYPKVILIDNNSLTFNEPDRQKLLIDEARKIGGRRLLITLDADEIFSPNFETSAEWDTMINAKAGTIFEFARYNLFPDLQNMWRENSFPCGYMDDGAAHKGNLIHSARIPLPVQNDRIRMTDIKVLHFQYTDWRRLKIKHYWYQSFELINKVNNPIDIFRRYHNMDSIDKIEPIRDKWIDEFQKMDIDITSVYQQNMLYWEKQILDYMDTYGVKYFSHLNIWEVSWVAVAKKWNYPYPEKYSDLRQKWEKAVNQWLIRTQAKQNKWLVKKIDAFLKKIYN